MKKKISSSDGWTTTTMTQGSVEMTHGEREKCGVCVTSTCYGQERKNHLGGS